MKKTLDDLKGILRQTAVTLPAPAPGYALLDFPNYPNVGDSLIWLGEIALFWDVFKVRPSYVSTRDEYNPAALNRACPEGPIYLSGGGNFGDIWPKYQAFRQRVLAAHPDRKIVQLPQSIHFQSDDNVRATAAAITKHKNFSLLVRDEWSFEFARDRFECETVLSPDMAFALGPQDKISSKHSVVFLLREDDEKMAARGEVRDPSSVVVDWLQDDRSAKLQNGWILPLVKRLETANPTYGSLELAFRGLAHTRKRRGQRLLGSGHSVVTDRLHAHIFCLLMGIPHIVIDNSYGKLSRFMQRWTATDPLVRVAGSVAEAQNLLLQAR
ncbi:polysaccharide pyruvyl transferase family protein [Flaviflagellibacter deserti]|uniref:Polysaccharide pyruvyl transferase family protein n=1 Tax=Flaviflagellibacter deserti TaxID=2267266 RepID=A0ABV9Z5J8_9HYPH